MGPNQVEDLNIPRRELLYIITALNRAKTIPDAAKLLGISPRNLGQKKQKLGIYKIRGKYQIKQKYATQPRYNPA